jgi:flagellar hook-length control protein FliK
MSILQLPPTAAEPPAPDPSTGNGSGAPPGPPFASVLEHQQARTATAEGLTKQDRSQQQPANAPADGDTAPAPAQGSKPATDAKDQPAATGSDQSALAALLGAAPVVVATASTAPAPTAKAAGEPAATMAAPVTAASVQPATPATTASAPAPGAPALTPAAAPASESTTPAAPLPAAVPVKDAIAQLAADPGVTPQFAASRPSTPVATVPDDASPSSLPAAPETNAPSAGVPGAPVASHAARAAAASAPAATASAPATPAPQVGAPAPALAGPAPSTSSSAAAVPGRAVGLDRAVETVRLALSAAAENRVTRARIELSPRELGGIEIHLRQTADGLVARVVAQHAGAAQLLQHAGGELRRSLETQGLTLLQLDIGASGEQGGQAAGEQRGFGGAGSGASADGDALSRDDAPATDASERTLTLPNGALVDVLA